MIATILASLLDVVGEALRDELTPSQVAVRTLDAALDSGVPVELLRDHLTQRMIDAAELAADVDQARKTGRLP